jgi:hypothetical protein
MLKNWDSRTEMKIMLVILRSYEINKIFLKEINFEFGPRFVIMTRKFNN